LAKQLPGDILVESLNWLHNQKDKYVEIAGSEQTNVFLTIAGQRRLVHTVTHVLRLVLSGLQPNKVTAKRHKGKRGGWRVQKQKAKQRSACLQKTSSAEGILAEGGDCGEKQCPAG
jgi:hypothetical protein